MGGTPVAVLSVLVTANTGAASAQLTRLDRQLRGTSRSTTASAAALGSGIAKGVGIGTLALGLLGAGSVKAAADFDNSMRRVNSIAQLPEKQLKKLGEQVQSLAGKTAQAPETLAAGLYDLVSSGFDAKESMKVLASSAKGASAGMTDTATSTKAVAAVLNAYRMPASRAKKVTDELFNTVNYGVISFEELAQNIGDTLPFASQLGVGLDQLGASIATMTKQGLSAPETMTRIRNILQALIKPGEDLKSTLDELNMSGEDLVSQYGMQGALEKLVGTTDGTKEAVARLFPNIRALGGVLALTGGNANAAEKDLKRMADSAGATGKAMAQIKKSPGFQWDRIKQQFKNFAIDTGQKLLPALQDVMKIIGDPKLTLDEKLERLGPKLAGIVESWVPILVKTALALGVAIVKGIWSGTKGALEEGAKRLGELYVNALIGAINDGISDINELWNKANPLGNLGPLSVAAPQIPEIPTVAFSKYQKVIDSGVVDTAKRGMDAVNGLTTQIKDLDKAMDAGLKPTLKSNAANIDALSDNFKDLRPRMKDTRGDMGDLGDSLDRTGEKTKKQGNVFRDVWGEVSKRSGKLAQNVTTNNANMVNTVGGGLGDLRDNVLAATKEFGVKSKITYSIKKADKAVSTVTNLLGAQKGAVVPGTGSGDTVPLHIDGRLAAMVEPGEQVSVLNRVATAAMMRLNEKIPRFQGGGIVPHLAKGGMAAMLALANKYERKSYPYLWGGGHGGFVNAGSPVDCSGAVSDILHAGGLLSGAPMVSGALMNWGKPAKGNEPLVVYANPVHTVMSLNGKTFGTSGSNPGGGAGWIEGGNGASLAPGAKRTMDVIGGMAVHLARQILQGPAGRQRRLGQAGLDHAWKAAKGYLAKQSPMGAGGGGDWGPVGDAIVKGRATWFTGGTMASGRNTDTDPGIALNPNPGGPDPGSWDNPTTQRWLDDAQQFLVTVGGKSTALPVLDKGPAGWTGNAIDVDRAGVSKLGFSTSSFPSGSIGTARIIKRQLGGLIPHLKGGSKKPLHGSVSGGMADAAWKRFARARKIADHLKRILGDRGTVARIDEKIGMAETLAGLDSSPMGSELAPEELAKQIRLNERLLETLTRARKLSRSGLKELNFPRSMSTTAIGKGQLRNLRGTFGSYLTDLTGVTGKGGRIFDTMVQLDSLRNTTTGSSVAPMDISGLRSVIEAARYGVFDSYAGAFAKGGRIPAGKWGITGERGPEPVYGGTSGATVLPNQALNPSIHVENNFDWEGMDLYVTTKVNGQIAQRERVSHANDRQYARVSK